MFIFLLCVLMISSLSAADNLSEKSGEIALPDGLLNVDSTNEDACLCSQHFLRQCPAVYASALLLTHPDKSAAINQATLKKIDTLILENIQKELGALTPDDLLLNAVRDTNEIIGNEAAKSAKDIELSSWQYVSHLKSHNAIGFLFFITKQKTYSAKLIQGLGLHLNYRWQKAFLTAYESQKPDIAVDDSNRTICISIPNLNDNEFDLLIKWPWHQKNSRSNILATALLHLKEKTQGQQGALAVMLEPSTLKPLWAEYESKTEGCEEEKSEQGWFEYFFNI